MIDEKDFIVDKSSKRKLFKAICNDCGGDRGYKRKTKADAFCKSCSQKHSVVFTENVDPNDFIEVKAPTKNKLDRVLYKYKTSCLTCLKDKGYLLPKDALKPCLSCAAKFRHKNMCPTIKQRLKDEMSKPLKEEIKQKISNTLKGKKFREYKPMSEESKIKISCTKQGINVKDFDGYLTPESHKERVRFSREGFRDNCFSAANYICDLYGVKGEELNAHHLDSWHGNEDKRFEAANLVCLSKTAHKSFHHKYGRKDNTKEQYEEFKAEIEGYKQTKQDLLLVAGCIASGKSWVCNQLASEYNYVSYDGTNNNYHVYELLKNNNKQLLYDPTIKISTFTKRYGHLFNVRLVVIVEDEAVINQRMLNRGGKITDTIKKRIKRMSNLSKSCEFSGTSAEVLEYLQK